ncbi:MAG TPA: radical SAM protein [Spirochaetota bacterium]|nr:radical SAM protein [Spirochaetota bacterium]
MSKTHMTIPIFVPHLGCPHRCVFCNQWETSAVRTPPDASFVREKIRAHLETKAASIESVEAAFFGGSFTAIDEALQRELLGAAHGFIRDGLIRGIRLSTRPDCVNTARLELLHEYGVHTIEIGAQSFSDVVLAASGRGHSAADSIDAAARIRQAGFSLVIQLMPGLPGDGPLESLRSARTAADCAPDAVRIYPAVVLEHTRLADLYREGRYEPLSLEDALERSADMRELFAEKNIPVIRTGLHPLAPGETAGVLAGPYHPAFGFLVKARLKRRIIERELAGVLERSASPPSAVRLQIPLREKEEYLGHRGENMEHLKARFAPVHITRILVDSDRPEIIIETAL